MNWVSHETIQTPPPPISDPTNLQNKISPSILLIILILAIIFFISGLLHLLVRYLIKPTTPTTPTSSSFPTSTTAFQGQLQHLFNLHDSGVDQAFIDSLPVFLYRAIIGVKKDPFDCAVCLCEFNQEDKLRLLPKCSHAFHLECIDTWLLSHSTCPLCRSCLLDYSTSCSPLVLVLESGSDSSREIGTVSTRRESLEDDNGVAGKSTGNGDDDGGGGGANEETQSSDQAKVVHVKLGKFRNLETTMSSVVAFGEGSSTGTETGTGTEKLDQRRCYSMGTYEYVMDERCSLRVPITKPPKKKPAAKRPGHHRAAMSECDCHSRREGFNFKGFDQNSKISEVPKNGGVCKKIGTKESFSISKTWLRTTREIRSVSEEVNSRRSVSFRLPIERNYYAKPMTGTGSGNGGSPVTESEYNVSVWDKSGSAADWDVESGNCDNGAVPISRADERPSFARRTLLWIMGRHEQR